MKIEPALTPPMLTTSLPGVQAGAGPSFSDWLQAPDQRLEEVRQRTFGFSELALSGKAHAVSMPGEDIPPALAPQAVARTDGEHIDLPIGAAAAVVLQTTHLYVTTASPSAPTPGAAPSIELSTAPVRSRPMVQAGPVLQSRLQAQAVTMAAEEAGAPPRPPSLASSSSRVNLLARDLAGALHIAAAAPDLTPESTDLLRRRLIKLTEEFGLQISDLHVNGLTLTPYSNGASNGRFAG